MWRKIGNETSSIPYTLFWLASAELASAADVLMRLNRDQIDLLGSAYLVVFVDMQGSPPAPPRSKGWTYNSTVKAHRLRSLIYSGAQKRFTAICTPKQTGTFTIGPLDFQTPTGSKTLQANLRVTASMIIR